MPYLEALCFHGILPHLSNKATHKNRFQSLLWNDSQSLKGITQSESQKIKGIYHHLNSGIPAD